MGMKVIVSGGGTGGHIFPALSIADELKRTVADVDILFVGAEGKMEMERVPAAGYKIEGLPVMGMPRKASLKMFKFAWKLLLSMLRARKIVRKFKPDFAIGVGGFASGPVLKAAARQGVPTFLQEQNSYAGVTNRLLAQKVRKICVAYEGLEKFFPAQKLVLTGNPVRKSLLNDVEKQDALACYGLQSDKPVVLIVGGSLGARTLNEAVLAKIEDIAQSGIQFIWQTGKIYYQEMQDRLKGKDVPNLKVLEFLKDMDKAYEATDLVVARAGASTISELCLLGKASILVPSPNVAEDHQTKNAMALVDKEAAVLVKDKEAIDEMILASIKLVRDEERLSQLRANIKQLAKPNATEDIVKVILENIG